MDRSTPLEEGTYGSVKAAPALRFRECLTMAWSSHQVSLDGEIQSLGSPTRPDMKSRCRSIIRPDDSTG